MSKVVIQLDPVSCPSCIKKIEGAISKVVGVEEVKVLFNSSKVKADFDETLTSGEAIRQIIEKLGYGVQTMKVA